MLKRILAGLALILVLLTAVAAYFLYSKAPPLPAGKAESNRLTMGAHARSFTVFSPSQLKPGAAVLFIFHASHMTGDDMRRIVGGVLEPIAEKDNVVIVYPEGYEGYFNDCRRDLSFSARKLNIDDVAYTKAIVAQLAGSKQTRADRTFAIGHSMGGQMVMRLMLEAPELLKGAVVISANLPAADNMDCRVTNPVLTRSIMFIAGTHDPISPYGGGPESLFGFVSRGNVLSTPASAAWFAQKLALETGKIRPFGEGSGLKVYQQGWSAPASQVRLLTIEGGGHTLPQAPYRFPRILGPTFQSNTVLESAWTFLRLDTR